MAKDADNQIARLSQQIDLLQKGNILCIGDVMLDRYIHGTVDRISPEAPIPVFNIDREFSMLGGAGNVARNLTALGASVTLVAAIGDDQVGKQITTLAGKAKPLVPYLLVEKDRKSTKKTRYIAGSQQILRSDSESASAITTDTEAQILNIVREEISNHDIVVLSDYRKGVLTPTIIAETIACAKKHGKPVVVDPKQRDFTLYRGAHTITPNQRELHDATNMPCDRDEKVVDAARSVLRDASIDHVLVTRGGQGMTLVSSDGTARHIPAKVREVFDVSGAGDTAVAVYAAALALDMSPTDAATLANVAAGIVVGKAGTAVVYRTDLKTALHTHTIHTSQGKILPLESALQQVAEWREENYKIGFTNGCFDLLHQGHLELLHDAKHRCEKLIVAVNSDASVKRLKGEERPVNGEMERAMMLASLAVVDMVVIFREDTPMELITSMQPHVLFKGADYTKDKVVGAEVVEGYGGDVVLIPLKEGYSTTKLIERIA